MAILPPKNTQPDGRLPSTRRVAMADTANGKARMRRWPRKRAKATTAQLEQRAKFKAIQMAAKWMAPQFLAQYTDAVKGTPLLPRDLITSFLYNRLAAFVLPDGKVLYPMPARTAVSQSLDTIGQTDGEILIRGPDGWQPIDATQLLPQGCRYSRSSPFLATGTTGYVNYDTVDFEQVSLIDPNDSSKFIADVTGWYYASLWLSASTSAGTYKNVQITMDGKPQGIDKIITNPSQVPGIMGCAAVGYMEAGNELRTPVFNDTPPSSWATATLTICRIATLQI